MMKIDSKILKSLSLVSQIGLIMALPIIGCIVIGAFLDTKFNLSPVFLIIFTVLGVLAAFRNLFVIGMKTITKKGKKDSNR